MTKSQQLERRAEAWLRTKRQAAKLAGQLKEEAESLLDAFVNSRETTVSIPDEDGVSHKLTRVAGEKVTIDLDLLKQVLTPAQRKVVFPRKVIVTNEFDGDALARLIDIGKVVPNTVPYITTQISPYIKDTPEKAGK